MGDNNRSRRGFTLVELLVVIAIIGILVFLLLPAVQSAREAARTTQCRNNLKQVATAIIQYETAFGRLPPAGLVEKNLRPTYAFGEFNPRRGKMISWAVLILPYLEEQHLYKQYDLKQSILEQERNPQELPVSTYICPSGLAVGQKFAGGRSRNNPVMFAKGNYAAWVSPLHTDTLIQYPGALGGGKWVEDSKHQVGQKTSAVTDGLSKTLMLSEVRIREDERDQRGVWALPWTGSSLLAFDVHHDPDSEQYYEPWDFTFDSAQTPNHVGENQDMLYACPDPEISRQENMPCGQWEPARGGGNALGEGLSSNHYLSAAPRSFHPGGVVVANMDGSIAFLSDSVDPPVMAFLVSANDGEQAELSDLTQ